MGYGLCGASISSSTCAVRLEVPAVRTPHRDGSFHALSYLFTLLTPRKQKFLNLNSLQAKESLNMINCLLKANGGSAFYSQSHQSLV